MFKKIIFFCVIVSGITFQLIYSVFAENITAQELYDQGQAAANAGDTAKAIDFYEKAIDADADFVAAYSALGSSYLENNGNIDDIVWLFQQAADLEPKNPEHYFNMCRAYFQFQKHDWAEAACLMALSIDSNNGAPKMILAYVYLYGKNQPADAIKYFKEILERAPNPKIYFGLGMAYARNNEQANALDIITTLRGKGEEALASQLEKMVRQTAQPAMPTDYQQATHLPPIESGPSKVITARTETKPKPKTVSTDENAVSPGKIRIQLRARLPSTTGESKDDDSYGPQDYKPLTLKERQDRVKRMRGNVGKASGSGTVSTQTQGQ
ncbi:MAG: tetratricopeptide repeat protein [Candidatus Omnitrophica bacterium]|nr:tetratricopeptide repeat protein [Candidatus Omnitrophota bacterium]